MGKGSGSCTAPVIGLAFKNSLWGSGVDHEFMAMAADEQEMAAAEQAATSKIEARSIQRGAYRDAVELQAEINAASPEDADLLLDQYDASRRVAPVVSTYEKRRLLEEYSRSAGGDSIAHKERQKRKQWSKAKQKMAEQAVLEPVAPEGAKAEDRTPLVALLQSEDFQEVRKSWMVEHIHQHSKSPTGIAAEAAVKGPIAGLGGKSIDPENPVAFYWKNPDTSRLYFIQLYPSPTETDPFDIVIDMEDVEGETAEQYRLSVKAPRGKARSKSSVADFASSKAPRRNDIKIPFHSVSSEEIKDPDKLFNRIAASMLGGGDTIWAGALDDQVNGAPLRTWAGIHIPDPSVRRAMVLARHAKVEKQKGLGVRREFVLDRVKEGEDPKGHFEWRVPVPQPDGTTQEMTFIHPAKYAAIKVRSGSEPDNDPRPASRKGGLVPVAPLPDKGGVLRLPSVLVRAVLLERYLWSRSDDQLTDHSA